MQNKPNFQKSQMNISIYLQTAYKNKFDWTLGENKPNSNPIKPNCRKGKIDAKCVFTKDYRKKNDFAVRKNKPNSNPISEKPKMNANVFITKDYENETAFRLRKNKPKQTQFKACPERSRMGQFQTAGKRTKQAKKKKRASETFLRLWLAGKIDFLDGFDILYLWEISI